MPLFPTAIQRLPSLPAEVVHKVLADLQLSRILHIICAHDIPYLDFCVTSNIHIGKVLPWDRLSEIKAFFTLYLDIIKLHRHPGLHRPHIPPLECDAATFLTKGGSDKDVIYHITSAVLIKLDAYNAYRKALRASHSIPSLRHFDATDAASLRQFFEMMLAAETAMNKKKSDQLKRIAQMMKDYPKSLKATNDPSQELRRNEEHIIQRLTGLSEKMVRPQLMDKCFVAPRYFASHSLFLVPYDRLLRGFLKVVRRFPPDKHPYPPEMATVLEGIKHIYLRSSVVKNRSMDVEYPRTKYTPYSPEPTKKKEERHGGMRQPQFNMDSARFEFQHVHDRIQPMADRELDWLEGFLKVCRYMSTMREKWTEELRVDEYWKKHYDI